MQGTGSHRESKYQNDTALDLFVGSSICKGAVLTRASRKTVVYTLPKDQSSPEDLLRVFTALEKLQSQLKEKYLSSSVSPKWCLVLFPRFGVVEWGVSQTSLEDVFMNLVKETELEDMASPK